MKEALTSLFLILILKDSSPIFLDWAEVAPKNQNKEHKEHSLIEDIPLGP